ncbi:MAG: HlyD family efflux transporter periplasmic adaptor subunit [Tabrizicola sp.]|jgi:multidrug efflux pump subunit AcrA (membrane-fusion protein)|nr:HlyD family efflux transporter periplasmic adaptor subunit [Tabrizicola sp.]
MRFLGRSLTGLFLFLATLGLLGAAVLVVGSALRGPETAARPGGGGEEPAVAAPVTLLTGTPLTPVLTAHGRIEARRSLELRSPQAGRVIWVSDRFQNGLSVAAKEVIARLDPVPATEALALAEAGEAEALAAKAEAAESLQLAEADLAAAEAQATLRRQALDRQTDLAARGAGSPQAVETAELALSSAEQAVLSRRQALAAARARIDQTAIALTRAAIALDQARRALSETEITADIGGRVAGAALVPGRVLTANEGLGQIIDPSALDLALRLSARDAARLIDPATGALYPGEVVIDTGATGPITGRLDRIAAALAAGETGRLVYVAVDDPSASLLPGDFVTARISEPALPDAARLPATALGGDGTILVLGPGDRLEAVPATLLRREGDTILIAVGDLAGREVVTERSVLLGQGIRIRPIRPEAAASTAADGQSDG